MMLTIGLEWRLLTVAATTFLLGALAPKSAHAQESATVPPTSGRQQAQVMEKSVTKILKAGYLLYLPKDYGKEPGKKWSLLFFLHGSGESGSNLEKLKAHGMPKLIAAGKEFPFIVVSPQAPDGPKRGWDVEVLNALLDDVLAAYSVDTDRVYLSGLSMGGYGAWAWATANPERFAAVVPICGGGQPRMAARRLKEMPLWVFHGAKDPTVPLQESEQMVEALKKAGATEVKFTVYPEAAHDSWTVTYDNPEVFTWLLEHKRAAPKSGQAQAPPPRIHNPDRK